MLLQKISNKTISDERGTFSNLITFGVWKEANLITSKAGTVRGNHYHVKATEVFIILDGEVEVYLQKVENGKNIGEIERHVVKGGDVFLIKPYINHTFFVKKDSKWINLLSELFDKDDFLRAT